MIHARIFGRAVKERYTVAEAVNGFRGSCRASRYSHASFAALGFTAGEALALPPAFSGL